MWTERAGPILEISVLVSPFLNHKIVVRKPEFSESSSVGNIDKREKVILT